MIDSVCSYFMLLLVHYSMSNKILCMTSYTFQSIRVLHIYSMKNNVDSIPKIFLASRV